MGQFLATVLVVGLGLIFSTVAQAADKPNIVFILTDNLGDVPTSLT